VTWTYSVTSRTARNQVRERIGDVLTNDQMVADEIIDERLTARSNDTLVTAIDCVRIILARIARDVDRSGASISGSRDQKTQHYREVLERLEKEAGLGGSPGYTAGVPSFIPGVYLSGMSESQAEDLEDDTDFTGASFGVGDDDWGNQGNDPEVDEG
jgi:hypothetical protein